MPGLACRHQPIILSDSDVCLTKTEDGRSGDTGKTIVEVSLDLCSEFQAIIFITGDIEPDSGGKGREAERALLIQIDIALLILILRKIIEEILCSRYALTCVESVVIADESVEANLWSRFLRPERGTHCQSGK